MCANASAERVCAYVDLNGDVGPFCCADDGAYVAEGIDAVWADVKVGCFVFCCSDGESAAEADAGYYGDGRFGVGPGKVA